jgi:hypothetical protein
MKKLLTIALLSLVVMACRKEEKPKNENDMIQFPKMALVNSLNFRASVPDGGERVLGLSEYNGSIVDTFVFYGLVSTDYVDKRNSFTLQNNGDSERTFELSIKYSVYGNFVFSSGLDRSNLIIRLIDSSTNGWVDNWVSGYMDAGDINLNIERKVSVTVPASTSRTFHFTTLANPLGYNPDYSLDFAISVNLFGDVKTPQFTCKSIPIQKAFNVFFGEGKWNIQQDPVNEANNLNYHFLSGDMICGYPDAVMTIKPADLVNEFCCAAGYTYGFDANGIAQFKPISQFVPSENITQLSEVRDLAFRYDKDLIYSAVSVGYNSPSMNYPLFRQQFAETLTYTPNQRGGDGKTYDIVCNKLRVDYAGLLLTRYEYENLNKQGTEAKRYKDVWMVHVDESVTPNIPKMDGVTTNLLGGGVFNVYLSPARMLARWKRYLSTIFGVWSDTPVLTLSAQENTENQMQSSISWDGYSDNVTEKATEQPLGEYDFTPMQCTFTTLAKINDINTFDKIAFSHRGKTYEAIVKSVTTTNRLEELEITALLTHKIA